MQTQAMWRARHQNNPGTAMCVCWGIVPADLHALLLLFKCGSGGNLTSSATTIHLSCQFPESKNLFFFCNYIYWIPTSSGGDVFRVPLQTTKGLINSGCFGAPIPPCCPLCFSVEVSEMQGSLSITALSLLLCERARAAVNYSSSLLPDLHSD